MVSVFDKRRAGLAPILLCGLIACAPPGRLEWDGGADVLRTALVKFTSEGDLHQASVLLSNGQLECGLPVNDAPTLQTQAYQALGAAICRDNARHVNIELFRRGGGSWEGAYDGVLDEEVADPGDGMGRLATATYFGVERAFLVDLPHISRGYAVAEGQLREDMADGGQVIIRRDGGRLVGSFVFPEGQVKGTFRAEICEDDTSTLDWLHPTPAHICP